MEAVVYLYVAIDSHWVVDFVRTDHNELSESIYGMYLNDWTFLKVIGLKAVFICFIGLESLFK